MSWRINLNLVISLLFLVSPSSAKADSNHEKYLSAGIEEIASEMHILNSQLDLLSLTIMKIMPDKKVKYKITSN
tara:strand:- start:318 stop:539 length:222 start_codon:yes stop_codon:yes gene_type:complete